MESAVHLIYQAEQSNYVHHVKVELDFVRLAKVLILLASQLEIV
jgi:hypothetical protein